MLFAILFLVGIVVAGWIIASALSGLAGAIVFSVVLLLLALCCAPLIGAFEIGKFTGKKKRK